jgi:hypothetical protein
MDSPILTVARIKTSPEHISAELRIGDRHERIELGLAISGLLAFEHMPTLLDCNTFARDAVISLMTRAHGGEDVSLPADLSDIVRQANEPWPLPHTGPTDGAPISVTATQVAHDTPEAGLTTVRLRIADSSAIVIVDRRGGPDEPVRFRFVAGPHPWQTTPAESHAMLTALLSATCSTASP